MARIRTKGMCLALPDVRDLGMSVPRWRRQSGLVLEIVAQVPECPVARIIGADRCEDVRPARWAFYRISRAIGASTPAIGWVCRRDHTSILHGLGKAAEHITLGTAAIRHPDLHALEGVNDILDGMVPSAVTRLLAIAKKSGLRCAEKPDVSYGMYYGLSGPVECWFLIRTN